LTNGGGAVPLTTVSCQGFQVVHAPEWSGSLSYEHDFRLANASTITFDTSLRFSSSHWLATDFTPAERQGSFTVLDANLTYHAPGERWSITAFGRNLGDTTYYTGGISSAFIPNLFNANIAPPRTYGIRVAVKIGD
jgi:iron complex outermembrane receptor protein